MCPTVRNVTRPDCLGRLLAVPLALIMLALVGGCPASMTPPDDGDADFDGGSLVFNNTTDLTNDGATYIGSDACAACHRQIGETIALHGHSQALHQIEDGPPTYPEEGSRAGVPNPPDGYDWGDISYVISGYLLGAFFVDDEGYVMTTGVDGVDTQWNLEYLPPDTAEGFVSYKPEQAEPLPYAYETCFRCHTTGPQPRSAENPRSQGNRPGILGTWEEAGVRCEACHGPGSNHAPNPEARDIFVDTTSADTCGRCHAAGDTPEVIVATDGYIKSNSQYSELLASGGHSGFTCTICHDPHASMAYDRSNGWRNECTACHRDQNLAFHERFTFERGEYTEEMDCQSCHMPFTGKSNSVAGTEVVGTFGGRMGDVRSHIFRIDMVNAEYTAMFSEDGSQVVTDAQGRAAVTVDFVCLRCHNGVGNAFLMTPEAALRLSQNIHTNAAD